MRTDAPQSTVMPGSLSHTGQRQPANHPHRQAGGCAEEWRDQVNTYFFRKSGVPDAQGRRIY
jgi:alpha-glucuronidase